jgi:hypothetical protein
MNNLYTFNEFLNEEARFTLLLEGEVNLQTDKFALVFVGGSIGQSRQYPIFIGGSIGSIYETGNDKEALKEKAKRMRKNLSPGERKYYGMNYTVIELTPSKIKDVNYLLSKRQETEKEPIEQ